MYDLKYTDIKTISLSDLMIIVRGNQTAAAERLGINRGTLRRYLTEGTDVLIKVDGFNLKLYVSDRKSGHYKKEAK